MKCISVDIGSTWTKGLYCSLVDDELEILSMKSTPTTSHYLPEGFYLLLGELLQLQLKGSRHVLQALEKGDIPVYISSSAKGGLRIAAIGIVPELTLKAAAATALSAGAKVVKVFSYNLTPEDIEILEEIDPDIILLTGGTDGGNRDYPLYNARCLAEAGLSAHIVYAGNRSIRHKIAEILRDVEQAGRMWYADNILPDLETVNPVPAREKLHEIFLKRIVEGKGLQEIVQIARTPILPTPYSVLEFVSRVRSFSSDWGNFALIDLGGATTDFYSACGDSFSADTIIKRGLPEPRVKRTVEGDLGMRINAEEVADHISKNRHIMQTAPPAPSVSVGTELDNKLDKELDSKLKELSAWARKTAARPDLIAKTTQEKEHDKTLAAACISIAAERHTGVTRKVQTGSGEYVVQYGKDLRAVDKVIGTGGFLSRMHAFDPRPWIYNLQASREDEILLIPKKCNYYQDRNYLIPLLANLAPHFPQAVIPFGISRLVECDNFLTKNDEKESGKKALRATM